MMYIQYTPPKMGLSIFFSNLIYTIKLIFPLNFHIAIFYLTSVLLRDRIVKLTRPRGQAVKTPPFHGGIMGSIPVGVTKTKQFELFSDCFVFSLIHNYYKKILSHKKHANCCNRLTIDLKYYIIITYYDFFKENDNYEAKRLRFF